MLVVGRTVWLSSTVVSERAGVLRILRPLHQHKPLLRRALGSKFLSIVAPNLERHGAWRALPSCGEEGPPIGQRP